MDLHLLVFIWTFTFSFLAPHHHFNLESNRVRKKNKENDFVFMFGFTIKNILLKLNIIKIPQNFHILKFLIPYIIGINK